ncbi:DUF3703 domain-containing protein [Rhodococcus koreensis]
MAAARSTTEDTERWRHLERAHILSQPYPWPHTRNHIAMRALALRPHDRREALGQVVRIIGVAPGSALARCPEGNTGRTRAGTDDTHADPADRAETLAVQA